LTLPLAYSPLSFTPARATKRHALVITYCSVWPFGASIALCVRFVMELLIVFLAPEAGPGV